MSGLRHLEAAHADISHLPTLGTQNQKTLSTNSLRPPLIETKADTCSGREYTSVKINKMIVMLQFHVSARRHEQMMAGGETSRIAPMSIVRLAG